MKNYVQMLKQIHTAQYKSNLFHCQTNIVIVLYWQRDLSAYQCELDLITKSKAPSVFHKMFFNRCGWQLYFAALSSYASSEVNEVNSYQANIGCVLNELYLTYVTLARTEARITVSWPDTQCPQQELNSKTIWQIFH